MELRKKDKAAYDLLVKGYEDLNVSMIKNFSSFWNLFNINIMQKHLKEDPKTKVLMKLR